MITVLYIAGPMTGIPDFNRAAFNHAAAELRHHGYTCLNPTENTITHPDRADAWQQYMRLSLQQLACAEGLALLDGWERSRGAALEVYVGTHLGLAIMSVAAWRRASHPRVDVMGMTSADQARRLP